MSFKTNPILNRLKARTGWKQSTFPFKSSNYSRDITFALKIYLLLKAYLTLNNFKLLMCQIRGTNQFQKTIYIIVTYSNFKIKTKKKISKNYLTSFSVTQYLPEKKAALYLLYHQSVLLKQFTTYSHYIIVKKKPSKLWWKKTYVANWLAYFIYIKNLISQTDWKTKHFNLKRFKLQFKIYKSALKVNNKYKRWDFDAILRYKLLFMLHHLERNFFFLTKTINFFNNWTPSLNSTTIKNKRYLSLLLFLKSRLRINISSLKKTLTFLMYLYQRPNPIW